MVRKDRLKSTFMELLRINSPVRGEAALASYVSSILKDMGLSILVDSANRKTGGDTGNLIANLSGDEGLSPIMLNAHLDTVEPTKNIVLDIEGDIIRTDGNSILGADDKSGIACILEILRVIIENNLPHPPVDVVFTVSEEIGLLGAKNMDYSMIKAKVGYTLDACSPFEVIVGAPYQNSITIEVRGKESHAGCEPSKGINAIKVASNAISKITTGQIDRETTANIGVIKGGTATNIIPGYVEVKGEVRSYDEKKLERKTREIEGKFEGSCKLFQIEIDGNIFAPTVRYEVEREYNAFKIDKRDELVKRVFDIASSLNMKIVTRLGGGGSDANIFNEKGIRTVIMGSGMKNIHTKSEYINLEDMVACVQILIGVISSWR